MPRVNPFYPFFKAGIASANNPEQLLIALEPEAASIHCREKKMKDFTSERGDADISDVFARPAAKYLVVDIGGNLIACNITDLVNHFELFFSVLFKKLLCYIFYPLLLHGPVYGKF